MITPILSQSHTNITFETVWAANIWLHYFVWLFSNFCWIFHFCFICIVVSSWVLNQTKTIGIVYLPYKKSCLDNQFPFLYVLPVDKWLIQLANINIVNIWNTFGIFPQIRNRSGIYNHEHFGEFLLLPLKIQIRSEVPVLYNFLKMSYDRQPICSRPLVTCIPTYISDYNLILHL